MPIQSLYIVKLFLRTGLVIDYNFTDAGRAVVVKDTCAHAMFAAREAPKQPRTAANPGAEAWTPPAICKFIDDARREAHWCGKDIIGVQMPDLHEDIEMGVRTSITIKRYTEELLRRAGEMPEPQASHAPYQDVSPNDPAPRAPVDSIARFST